MHLLHFNNLYIVRFLWWYINDISIFSLAWYAHIENLYTVLMRLQSAGLILQLPKYSFGAKACEFLEHKIGSGYISPQQAKVDAVAKFTNRHIRLRN